MTPPRIAGRFTAPATAQPAPLLVVSEASRLASALATIGARKRAEERSLVNWRTIAALRAEIAARRVMF